MIQFEYLTIQELSLLFARRCATTIARRSLPTEDSKNELLLDALNILKCSLPTRALFFQHSSVTFGTTTHYKLCHITDMNLLYDQIDRTFRGNSHFILREIINCHFHGLVKQGIPRLTCYEAAKRLEVSAIELLAFNSREPLGDVVKLVAREKELDHSESRDTPTLRWFRAMLLADT